MMEVGVLWALWTIENNMGLMRDGDFISAECQKWVKDSIMELCGKLMKEVATIVDVVAPPDYVIGSPFGA